MKIQMVSVPVNDPVRAHDICVFKLGFIFKVFDAEASLALVVSPEEQGDTESLLEP